jgi:hypothetical protein
VKSVQDLISFIGLNNTTDIQNALAKMNISGVDDVARLANLTMWSEVFKVSSNTILMTVS